jgi:predicted kinase
MRRAGAVLRSGRPVVLDGCFRFSAQRMRAKELAREFGHPFLFVEARVSEDVCRERLRERSMRDDEPDSTWIDIANQLRAQWEPTDELSAQERQTLDTSIPLAENAERVRARLPTWPAGLTD